jgi:hypothetical protein
MSKIISFRIKNKCEQWFEEIILHCVLVWQQWNSNLLINMHIFFSREFTPYAWRKVWPLAKSLLSGKILLTDRRATIRTVLKVVYFLRTTFLRKKKKKKKKKARTVWGIFLHSHTQSDPKQGIKKFLRHFPTALVFQFMNFYHSKRI